MEVLEAGELRRFPLAPGRTRIGGLGCEVVLASAPAGEVHIWDGPPRALYTGGGGRDLNWQNASLSAALQGHVQKLALRRPWIASAWGCNV